MLRRSLIFHQHKHLLQTKPSYERITARRRQLEQRRQAESAWHLPPVEPSAEQAIRLYRQLLKKGNEQLKLTDKACYRRKLRYEFEEVARQTSGRVRGVMFSKGQWMLKNNLGGLL